LEKGIRLDGLGDRVLVKARVKPKKYYDEERWEREEVQAQGIVCGMRTIFEGCSDSLDEDADWAFVTEKPAKTYLVYLVAVNMQEIWHVLPGDMKLVGPATCIYCPQYDCLYYRDEDGTCSSHVISLPEDCVCEEYNPV